jgi:regulator of nonsense transcripts 2
MKTQQQADREEQQRIKNLVLSYDPGETEQPEGEDDLSSITQEPIVTHGTRWNPNRNAYAKKPSNSLEKRPSRDTRMDKSNRSGFRARRLQLSDVDW